MEEVKMLPTIEWCRLLQLSSSPPFDWGAIDQELELRDTSNLLHPMDGGGLHQLPGQGQQEIGRMSLHNFATVDCTYNTDSHI